MGLYNRINSKLLKQRLHQSSQSRTTLSFYKYHAIEDPLAFRDALYVSWEAMDVWGRIYVAKEGINAQLSVPVGRFTHFRNSLYAIPFLEGFQINIAREEEDKSFLK